MTTAIATVDNLTIRTAHGRLLVNDLSLQVCPGEAIAIVGESGSGKSMTARALTGLLPDGVTASGSLTIAGTEYAAADDRHWRRVRGRNVTWLPQDPFTMLSPVRQAKESVRDGARARLSDADIQTRLAEVGIAEHSVAERYPFQLSGGLRQRVGIAAALAGDPDILIADEPSTALDVTTQRQVLRLLGRLRRSRGLALVLITHDLRVALSVADRVYVLYAGALLEVAAPADIRRRPAHPYTHGLLMAEPIVEYRAATLSGIPGSVPSADDVSGECAFASRCRFVIDVCRSARPALRALSTSQSTACVRAEQISTDLALRVRPEEAIPSLAAPRPIVLAAERIVKQFGNLTALDAVSVVLREAEVVGIVGESGSGKTTLARIIAGLDAADSGTVHLEGGRRSAGRASAIQVVFQDPSATLNPSRKVGVTLRDALRAGAQPSSTTDVAALLAQVQLPASYGSYKPSSLSGGERQRVAIARALAPKPRVLLCDEPVSSLDVSVQAQILQLFRDLSHRLGVAMLFITHDLGVVRQIADRIYVLQHGRLVEEGTTSQLLDHPSNPYTRELIASVPRADPRWLDDATSPPERDPARAVPPGRHATMLPAGPGSATSPTPAPARLAAVPPCPAKVPNAITTTNPQPE